MIEGPIIGYRDARAMLEHLYIKEELAMNEIAMRCGLKPATIALWLRELGIPVRPRGGGNNKARYGRQLHLLDQRVIMQMPTMELAALLGLRYSSVYKYKRGVTATWNSVLSVPQVG